MSFNHAGIARMPFALTLLATTTSIPSAATSLNGFLRGITVTASTLDSNATVTVTITDFDGTTVYSKSGIATAANAKTFVGIDANNQPLRVPLSEAHTVTVTATGSSAADHLITVNLLISK